MVTPTPFPQTLPSNTVVGRLSIGPGPAEAIPTSSLPVRTKLSANLNLYVRTDGNDNNSGLANTAAGAFLTIQHALNTVVNYDPDDQWSMNVNVGAGTFVENLFLDAFPANQAYGPANIIGAGASTIIDGHIYTATFGWQIKNVKCQNSGSGPCIEVDGGFLFLSSVNFGACNAEHIDAHNSATAYLLGDYTISGGASRHWSSQSNSLIRARGMTITLTGTPNFTNGFLGDLAQGLGKYQIDGITFVGGATGQRFLLGNGSVARLDDIGGSNFSYLPGDQPGAISPGAQWNGVFGCPSYSTPNTRTSATYTVSNFDFNVTANFAGTTTLTLLAAGTYGGKILFVRTIQNQAVVSASSNVIPLAGGSAGTAILAATAGKWALLQSDGASWQIIAGN